jgi:hypothetical protein
LINVSFIDCTYKGNSGAGFSTCLNALNASSDPVSILFQNGEVVNNSASQRSAGFSGCTVRVLRQKFTLEDAIEFYAFAPLEALACV